MHRLMEMIFLLYFFTKINGEQSFYFKWRKQKLEEMKIIIHSQPRNSKVDSIYYGPQKPRSSNYQLLINEDKMCAKHEKVFLFVAIRTIYSHHVQRSVFRESISHYLKRKSSLPVIHAFLFGKAENDSENNLIKEESRMFGDILQADFKESYGNLTLKTLLAWKWVVEYCPNTEYVMVTNDELFIDMDKLSSFLYRDYLIGHHDDRFALCYPVGNGPAVHRTRAAFTVLPAKDLYKGAYYPHYCHGYGYVAHIMTISKLLKASVLNPFFMPDDVWIGVLAEKLRLLVPNHRSMYLTDNFKKFYASDYYYFSSASIAVTDAGKYKGHERDVMLNIISSMRRQWQKLNESNEYWATSQISCPSELHNYVKSFLIVPFCILSFVICRSLRRKCRYI